MSGLSRRVFLQQSASVSIGISGMVSTSGYAGGQSAPPPTGSTAVEFVPEGFLKRATEAPGTPVEMSYSTATIPDPTYAENCQIPVYPWAVNCESALSRVYVSPDLSLAPNHVLVQNLVYVSENNAIADFDRIFRGSLDIFSVMVFSKAEPHESDNRAQDIRRFQLTVQNGLKKAMHLERRGSQIVLVRAGALDQHPWDTVDNWVDPAFAVLPETHSMKVGELEWRVSYGPIDFHPSVYDNPTCN